MESGAVPQETLPGTEWAQHQFASFPLAVDAALALPGRAARPSCICRGWPETRPTGRTAGDCHVPFTWWGQPEHPARRASPLYAIDHPTRRRPATASAPASVAGAGGNANTFSLRSRYSDGRTFTQKMVQDRVRWAARRAKLDHEGVHTLKHTFCPHLAMRGAPVRAIQELAGHQDLSTTQRYMHLSP